MLKQLDYSKELNVEGYWFSQSTYPKSWIRSDWIGTHTMEWCGGPTTPEYYMNAYGGINHIEESGWE